MELLPQECDAIVEKEGLDHHDHTLVKGTRPLIEVYKRCSIPLLEPTSFVKVVRQEGWMDTMHEEIHMIEKNKTWNLVDRPKVQKVIGVKWLY